MSPDIEWHVGDETDQETVIKTPHKQPSRWRKLAVSLVVVLGIGLGVAYLSIPRRQRSRPPSPPPVPPPLAETIDREAHALAAGDAPAYEAVLDPIDAQWQTAQLSSFQAWGAPPGTSQLYSIVATGTLADDSAWADVIQYRQQQYFSETRFYRLRGNQWFRSRPVLAFWSNPQTIDLPPFKVMFYEQDARLVRAVTNYLGQAYGRLCFDLNCPAEAGGLGRDRAFSSRAQSASTPPLVTLDFEPDVQQTSTDGVWPITITLPSPRLQGVYYQNLFDNRGRTRLGYNAWIEQLADHSLVFPAVRIAAGAGASSAVDNGGDLFVEAIAAWEIYRLQGQDPQQDALFNLSTLQDNELLPLADLWNWRIRTTQNSNVLEHMQIETSAVVAFVEQRFGPRDVVSLLNAIGSAGSLPQAIESSLPIRYDEFDQQWKDWARQYRAGR